MSSFVGPSKIHDFTGIKIEGDDKHITFSPRPEVVDNLQFNNLPLRIPRRFTTNNEPSDKREPCTASIFVYYSSSVLAAMSGKVADSISHKALYDKICKRLEAISSRKQADLIMKKCKVIGRNGKTLMAALGDDPSWVVRLSAAIMAECSMELLKEMASKLRIIGRFGEFEVHIYSPHVGSRATKGLVYCTRSAIGSSLLQRQGEPDDVVVILQEEVQISHIRLPCFIGTHSDEIIEQQMIDLSLKFLGPGLDNWVKRVLEQSEKMLLELSKHIGSRHFATLEVFIAFVADTMVRMTQTTVSVRVIMPTSVTHVKGSGLEIIRSSGAFR